MKRRGLSLTEVLLAGALMLAVMLMVEACVRYLWNNSMRMRNALEPRQQIRSFFITLRRDLRAASYLFLGYSGTLNGETVNVPGAGGSGDSLLFAVPADDSADTEYTVCMLVARPRTQYDANNPTARELLYHRFQPARSVPPDTPGGLVPANLAPGSSRVFDVYLPPGPVTGPDPPFSIRISDNEAGVQVMTHFIVQPQRGNAVTERYDAFFTLRNNV